MDQTLRDALAADDQAEDRGMPSDWRRTCHTHQCWAAECEDEPMHSDPHGHMLRGLSHS